MGLQESQVEVLYTRTILQRNANATTHTIESSIQSRQQTRHHDPHTTSYYIIPRHLESYPVTTDITAPRPPVWPYSYVSVNHAVSRRYGRYHHPPIRLEPDHGRGRESVGNGWAWEKGHYRRGLDVRKWGRGLVGYWSDGGRPHSPGRNAHA